MGNALLPSEKYCVASGPRNNNNLLPFTLLCSLFFLWAIANNLNDIFLPQFQEAFTLNNFQAGLIQSSFYFGHFIIPIPAGILIKKLNYKSGIISGLMFYAAGAALFWPAAQTMNYFLFLAGLFIIAAGLGCLETAANPFVYVSDAAGAIAPAELIPALCFGVIYFIARFRCGVKPEAGVAAVSH